MHVGIAIGIIASPRCAFVGLLAVLDQTLTLHIVPFFYYALSTEAYCGSAALVRMSLYTCMLVRPFFNQLFLLLKVQQSNFVDFHFRQKKAHFADCSSSQSKELSSK